MKQKALILLSLAALTFAQGYGKGQKQGEPQCPQKMCISQELGLTEKQQEQFKALRQEHRTLKQRTREAIIAEKKALNQLLLAPKVDKKALDAHIKKMGTTKTAMTEERVDYLLKVKEIMTPEQFTTFLEKQWQSPGKKCYPKGMGKGKNGSCGTTQGSPRGKNK
jgi:Spy/CpxP family protein refolding chaperone